MSEGTRVQAKGRRPKPKVNQVRLSDVSSVQLWKIRPAPENDTIYRPIDPNDPEIIELAASIRQHGIREPLVLTLDRFILSGHRRFVAAKLAGLERAPVRYETIRRLEDLDGFLVLLREYNRQREKTRDERFREELVTVNPDEAYQSLIEHRQKLAQLDVEQIEIGAYKGRKNISKAKEPFAEAVLAIVEAYRPFWPLSDRKIHYPLLNDPPLRHASKPHSRYKNDRASYHDLCDLILRLIRRGDIAPDVIDDETRPVTVWTVNQGVGPFVNRALGDLFKGYWRDLMQSQPNHVEILVEKNTVASIVKTVAAKYCIPMTSGRGFCSDPPRRKMAQRFKASGKEKLVILIVSDLDPSGELIAQSFARVMRDEFEIDPDNVIAQKVALTADQVAKRNLFTDFEAKKGGNYRQFVEQYGTDVYELEALEPHDLQGIVTDAIDAVIDVEAFNAELDAERNDAAFLQAKRQQVVAALKGIDMGAGDESRTK